MSKKEEGKSVWDIHVGEAAYPFFDSHRVQEMAVVPMLMAAEWFARLSRSSSDLGNQGLCYIKNLKVLKGIELTQFEELGNWYRLACSSQKTNQALTIESDSGRIHYSGEIAGEPSQEKHGISGTETSSNSPSNFWDIENLYKGKLFHGPCFQSIKTIESVDDNGCSAILEAPESFPFSSKWVMNLPVIDGGLQMALLWIQEKTGLKSLPVSMKELFLQGDGSFTSSIRTRLKLNHSDQFKFNWDLLYEDVESSEVIAWIKGLEIVVLPASEGVSG